MIRQQIVLSAAACLTIAGLAKDSSSLDERYTRFHGSVCQPAVTGSAATTTNPSYMNLHFYGVDLGTTTTAGSVMCPLVNTRDYNVQPYDPWNVSMTVYDRHETQNFSCTLYRQDHTGSVVWSQTQSTTGQSASPMYMTWWPPVVTGIYYYSIFCDVPAHGNMGYSHLTTIVMHTPDE